MARRKKAKHETSVVPFLEKRNEQTDLIIVFNPHEVVSCGLRKSLASAQRGTLRRARAA